MLPGEHPGPVQPDFRLLPGHHLVTQGREVLVGQSLQRIATVGLRRCPRHGEFFSSKELQVIVAIVSAGPRLPHLILPLPGPDPIKPFLLEKLCNRMYFY